MSPQGPLEYSEFFRAQFPRLVRGLRMTGVTTDEAKDMVQEAMAELLSIWPNCTHPYSWVRKVAWHKYLRAADRARRQAEGEARAGVPSAPVCEDPGEVAWVREILLGLPARQRAVMALYVDGYSIPEIAALLKTEVSTVRSNLRHARTTLRRRLEGPPPKDKS